MKQDLETIDKNLQEKFAKLLEAKFSETASYEFFGNLNILEIERLIEKIENNEIEIPNAEAKTFLQIYLKRLREEILLKQV